MGERIRKLIGEPPPPQQPRVMKVAHALPGRLRVRIRGLRGQHASLSDAAEQLAALPGIHRVVARPATGSLLFTYDHKRLPEHHLVEAVRSATRAERIAAAHEPDPPFRTGTEGVRVARAVMDVVRTINDDILELTQGHLDLGTFTASAFFVAGAARLAVTRERPTAPPWFNLAWWAFQTFQALERGEAPIARAARERPRPASGSKSRRRRRVSTSPVVH